MKLKTSTIIWTFLWCWFMGITAISIGFGAIFPSMNLVAKPFVCLGGKMDLTKQVYNPYPGNTITTLTWYCVDETSGAKTELGIFPMSLYSGTIYGWLFFGAVLIGMVVVASRRQKATGGTDRAGMERINAALEEATKFRSTGRLRQDNFANPDSNLKSAQDALSRMKELKELRAANLISETEYQEKRTEILKSL
ncbi:MAG TPA: SHOCT domain-containing protein [Anaerolineales bacterium]|nr:SHOCT domain-containing protein [Anaerolineales bacterium]HLO33291.1 SHOCT domain-containing protein [Anaerolineales bacterium]